MKDEVPLSNGFQPLDNVGAPKPRMPAVKTKTFRVIPQFSGSFIPISLSSAHQSVLGLQNVTWSPLSQKLAQALSTPVKEWARG